MTYFGRESSLGDISLQKINLKTIYSRGKKREIMLKLKVKDRVVDREDERIKIRFKNYCIIKKYKIKPRFMFNLNVLYVAWFLIKNQAFV